MSKLKEEYGEMELDDYNVPTQNPSPEGKKKNQMESVLIGKEKETIDKKKLSVGPGKTIKTETRQ